MVPEEPPYIPYFTSPDIPIWRSAKSAGETVLLEKGEINAFAEVEYLQVHVERLGIEQNTKRQELRSFTRQFPVLANGAPDFSQASPADLRTYLTLLTATTDATLTYRVWIRNIIGAETAVLAGKTKLEELYNAERAAHEGLRPGTEF
jgi:hypothetical protein